MGITGGVIGAALSAVPTWFVVRLAAANLTGGYAGAVTPALAFAAAVIGFLVGAAVVRRAVTRAPHLTLFSALAGGFGGGLAGALIFLSLTAAYLSTYSHWPTDIFNQVLFVLAFPVSTALGWFLGAGFGFIAGLAGGALLRLASVAAR